MKQRKIIIRICALAIALMMLLTACQKAQEGKIPTPDAGMSSNPTSGATQPSVPSVTPSQPATDTAPTAPLPTEPFPTYPEPDDSEDEECIHTDSDSNELCDICGIDVTVTIDFYGVNDLHGVFCDTENYAGVDELTTYFRNAYADDRAYEVLISSGDMWQGSIESNSNRGALMTKWMNYVGFEAMTLGNHEYDWGSQYIADNAAIADFPILAINVSDVNMDVPYCQPSVIIHRGGVRIGIIGAIGDVKSSISGEFTSGLEFAVNDQLTQLVKTEALRLRDLGCDLVVYSLHDGGRGGNAGAYYDLELSNGYIDLVLEGHSHSSYVFRDGYGVYHLQGGGYGANLSYVSLTYHLVNDEYQIHTAELIGKSVYANSAMADDPIVQTLITEFFPDGDPYQIPVGQNRLFRNAKELRRMLAQLYLQKGEQQWGSQYEIVLGGGYMSCRGKGLSAGGVTFDELYALFPFDNDLVLGAISGADLKSKFINSTNSNYFCAYDSSIVSKIKDNDTYYIITDTYSSEYAPNNITEVARLTGIYARNLLSDYIATGAWS